MHDDALEPSPTWQSTQQTKAKTMQSILNKATRKDLTSYMVDVHGFNEEDVAEWDNKADLISDIRRNGWERDCASYLGIF